MSIATSVQQLLGLAQPPVAIGFLNAIPDNLPHWPGAAVPAGCVFWEKAFSGLAFYTLPADHFGCAIGSYTHSISLPEARTHELSDTLACMVDNDYLAMAEVPGIPTLAKTPVAIAYGPADQVSFAPDVVLINATPVQAMLIYEAALKAGAGNALTSALGRPACAVLPLTTLTGQTALSLGCKGNRTFTDLRDDLMYVSIPGDKWPAVLAKLVEAHAANEVMERFYMHKRAQFANPQSTTV